MGLTPEGQDNVQPAVEDINDPFSPVNAPKLQLIVQMRIYDALMAILNNMKPEQAARLHEMHANGKIVGALPFIDLVED